MSHEPPRLRLPPGPQTHQRLAAALVFVWLPVRIDSEMSDVVAMPVAARRWRAIGRKLKG